MSQEIGRIKQVLLSCLREGGRIVHRGFGKAHTIKKKGPVSLVTEIDTMAERKIVSIIRKSYPTHRILTEESPPFAGSSTYRWIIDPLDGTSNYAHNIPICCVSIGLEKEGKVLLGGIYNPMAGELYFAQRGQGATLNGNVTFGVLTFDLPERPNTKPVRNPTRSPVIVNVDTPPNTYCSGSPVLDNVGELIPVVIK